MSSAKELDFKDQHARDLKLHVVQGELDIGQFEVLAEQADIFGAMQVHARIIGASHVISFKYGDLEVHEVFACADVATSGKVAFFGPLGKVKVLGEIWLDFKGGRPRFHYHFDVQELRLDSNISLLEALENKAKRTSAIGLSYEFPSDGGELLPAKTVVSVQNHVHVETMHTYPNDNILVSTRTIFS